jgi:hypothetical protein
VHFSLLFICFFSFFWDVRPNKLQQDASSSQQSTAEENEDEEEAEEEKGGDWTFDCVCGLRRRAGDGGPRLIGRINSSSLRIT